MTQTVLRTIFFYFFVMFAYRIMGKREVGQLGIIDLIVSILIAELVAISIENYNDSILYTVLPIGALVLLEIFLGMLSLKSRWVNKLLGGKPTIIIENGKILYKNLVSQRYGIDDLLLELRKASITSIEEVEYAFLETNGNLSIFPYKPLKIKSPLPLPIVVEGVIQRENLHYIGKDKEWLDNLLKRYGINLDEVFYAIYKKKYVYVIKR